MTGSIAIENRWTETTKALLLGFVGLTYLTTLGAEIHPYDDVSEWLRAAGFESVKSSAIRRAGPGNTLFQATKHVG